MLQSELDISKNGREVIARNQKATEKTVTEIAKLLLRTNLPKK